MTTPPPIFRPLAPVDRAVLALWAVGLLVTLGFWGAALVLRAIT